MNLSFIATLPPLGPDEQVPPGSSVRTLLRGIDVAPPPPGGREGRTLAVARALREKGFLRTALGYYAMAQNSDGGVILEPDGFARESHLLLEHARKDALHGVMLVAHNPHGGGGAAVSFAIRPGEGGARELMGIECATGEERKLYREESSAAQSGVLDALDRWYDLPFPRLVALANSNRAKVFPSIPTPERLVGNQCEMLF